MFFKRNGLEIPVGALYRVHVGEFGVFEGFSGFIVSWNNSGLRMRARTDISNNNFRIFLTRKKNFLEMFSIGNVLKFFRNYYFEILSKQQSFFL